MIKPRKSKKSKFFWGIFLCFLIEHSNFFDLIKIKCSKLFNTICPGHMAPQLLLTTHWALGKKFKVNLNIYINLTCVQNLKSWGLRSMCSMRAYNVDGKSAKWNLAKYLVCLLWKDIYPSKICLIDLKIVSNKSYGKKGINRGIWVQ